MPNMPWIRTIRVTLGPLEEWRGSTAGEIVQWTADGSDKTLRVTGTFQKTIMGIPGPSVVNIYNLGQEVRAGIKKSMTKVTVEGGWRNTSLRRIFQGSVVNTYTERSGPDLITKIAALPGYGALARGVASHTAAPGASVQDVALKLAQTLPGVNVSAGNLQGVTGKIGDGGWSFAGSTRDGLTRLSDEYGFSWSVSDGDFTAIGDKFEPPEFIEINGDNSGLVNITPIVQGPMQIQTGVKIKALYVPGVSTGTSVKVVSKLNPKLSGTYRIHTISISVDSHSDAWTMDIDSYRYM